MKKALISIAFALLAAIPSFSQDYSLAVRLFQDGEYAACYRQLEPLVPADAGDQIHLLSSSEQEYASYMLAASAFYLNRMDASLRLKAFLNDYPLSVYSYKAFFYLGTCAMNAGQYQDAIETFALCRRESLTRKEFEDYRFRVAFTSLQLERVGAADTLFQQLLDENGRYVVPATYYLAYIDYREGRAEEALQGFRKVADIDEYKSTVPFYIMQIQFNQGQYREMLGTAEQLLMEDPNESERMELYRLSGAGYYEMQNYASSLEYYDKYLDFGPELLRSDAYRIGMAHFAQKDYSQALKYLSKVTADDDALAQNATYHIGVCYLQQQKTDMARMSFERASLADYDLQTKEDALYNYALLCYETSFSPFNEQVKAFERILTEFPDSRYSDQIYSHLADAFLSTSNYQAAIDFINKTAHPSTTLLQTKCKLLFLLGVERFDNGDMDGARGLFGQSIDLAAKVKADATEARYWRGETGWRLNRLTEATTDFEVFVKAPGAPKLKAYGPAWYNLAYCYFNTRRYSDALNAYQRYLALNTDSKDASHIDAVNRIGDCYYYNRNYQQAEEYYRKTDQLTPDGNDYAVYQQAFCLGLRKQHQEKARLLASFEKRFPQSDYLCQALFEEGRAYIATDRPAEAIAAFQRLMAAQPNHPLSRKAGIQMGLLYFRTGDYARAIAIYQKVVTDYPGSDEARTAVNDLKEIYVATNDVQGYVDYVNTLGPAFAVGAGEQDSLTWSAAERLMVAQRQPEAIAGMKQYLEQFPQGRFRTQASYYCASLLSASGQKAEAIPYYRRVLEQPGNRFIPEALAVLSEDAWQQNHYQEALDYYTQWETLASERAERVAARTGVVRCLSELNRFEDCLTAVAKLQAESNLPPELVREIRYRKASALLALNRDQEATADLKELAKESQTAYGAEARYRLAQQEFDRGRLDQAAEQAQAFLRDGTPHAYWMARCFLLLSDVYMAREDNFQARQYLLSLKENYTVQDDIQPMIAERLERIAEQEQLN